MKRSLLVVIFCLFSMPAFATCKSDGADKKLSGAALTSFVGKCQKDAQAKCDADSKDKNLAGAAKTAHMKKCVADAVGS